jgi:hypothetical protein
MEIARRYNPNNLQGCSFKNRPDPENTQKLEIQYTVPVLLMVQYRH